MFNDSSEASKEVDKRVKERADNIGNKAANLEELKLFCDQNELGAQAVQVPSLLSVTSQQISQHLDTYAPDWMEVWKAFVEAQGSEQNDITEAGAIVLRKLRLLIGETFKKHPLVLEEFESYLRSLKDSAPQALLAVRSTGLEDAVDLANPGGNESKLGVKPDLNAISEAMGIVVASYFSEKSLKQRLLGKKSIIENPFVPVFCQKLMETNEESKQVLCSGVMYIKDNKVTINAAPGLGELIVNSKAPFDTYFVTHENVVHAEINRKTLRCVSSGGTSHTVLVENTKDLRDNPTFSPNIALNIANIGRLIEKHYGRPIDVEFTYDPKTNTLYLLQARPITPGEALFVEPSSIAPEKVAFVKKTGKIEKGDVIISGGNAAKIITRREELLVCPDIGTALELYLGQKNSPVKAVIVQEMSGETSHEAAQFNAQGIPVMQQQDTRNIEAWMDEKEPVIIIDPQRKSIINWTGHVKNHGEAVEELTAPETGIVKPGLFKSPLNPRETILPTFLPTFGLRQKRDIKLDMSKKIGDLITEANSPNPEISELAFNQLMQQLYTLIPEAGWQKTVNESFYPKMLKDLEAIESIIPNASNKEAFEALSAILVMFCRLAKSPNGQKTGSPHSRLFRQAIITGAEIYKSLTTLSEKSEGSKQDLDQLRADHLDLVAKLEGLVVDPGNKHLFSDSMMQIAVERKEVKNALAVPGSENLPDDQQKVFVELMKFKKLALNETVSEKWTEFALACCQDPIFSQKVSRLVHAAMVNGIGEMWINESFSRYAKEPISKTKETLRALEVEMVEIAKLLPSLRISEVDSILGAWERKLPDWRQPEQFNRLLDQYAIEIVPLIDRLNISDIKNPLVKQMVINRVLRLTELMDVTIKAITGSPEYRKSNPQLQVERFAILLEPYCTLMEKWISNIPVNISSNMSLGSSITKMKDIRDYFEMLKKNLTPELLKANPKLSVLQCGIDSPYGVKYSVGLLLPRPDTTNSYELAFLPVTLEFLFSLMHYNIKASVTSQNIPIKLENLPESMQKIYEGVSKIQGSKFINSEYHYPVVNMVFNLPVSSHALKYIVQYDQERQKIQIKVSLFSGVTDNRWAGMHFIAALDALAMNAEFRPDHALALKPEKASVTFAFEMDSKGISEKLPFLINVLSNYRDRSFDIVPNIGVLAKDFFDRLPTYSDLKIEVFLEKIFQLNAKTEPPFLDNPAFMSEFKKYLDKLSLDKAILAPYAEILEAKPKKPENKF